VEEVLVKNTPLMAAVGLLVATALLVGCEAPYLPNSADELPSFDVADLDDEVLTEPTSCAPLSALTCGSQVAGDTSDPNSGYTDVIDGYPVTVGNYSGPEVAYAFRPLEDGEVQWSLVDPDPTFVNFDLFVLDGSSGSCLGTQALTRGFNDVSFDAIAGHNYFLVLDGYDGDVGEFEVRLDCAGQEPAEDLVDETPDPATYGECLFGWLSRDIEAAPHLESQLVAQYTSAATTPALLGAQMVQGVRDEGWADVATVQDVFEYVDDDGVYEYSIVHASTGEHFTWLKWYAGDTEVGYIFRQGTLNQLAIIGDGDIHDCELGLES